MEKKDIDSVNIDTEQSKTEKIILIIIISVLLLSITMLMYSKLKTDSSHIDIQHSDTTHIQLKDTAKQTIDSSKVDHQSLKILDSLATTDTTDDKAIRLSENSENKQADFIIDHKAGITMPSVFNGKRINISITGLDGRLGRNSKLADANHVISILIETGAIEITSIPRDTYCDLGYEDSSGLNKLTICRAQKGRERYHKELARIARLDKIHYYIEFGFSQAMGIIEFLGFKEPSKTLQVLRNRKGLGGDDYQRCYTQGQFIRQAMLGHFNKFTGTFGGVLARAGLLMVETNLTGDKAVEIIDKLEKAGFPKSPESIVVRVRPTVNIAYKIYDFNNEETVSRLVKKIENFNKPRFDSNIEAPQPVINVQAKLDKVLQKAVSDTAKNPQRVISQLSPYFIQRAWYQVKDKNERNRIRNEFGVLLENSYKKRKQFDEAAKVVEIIEAEKKVFENK